MPTRWTKNQQKAIDIKNTNVLVSAAAGSGKTAVLVERVIKKITDESDRVYVNELLICTFTKAAATEMRDRIYKALAAKSKEQPQNTYLREQLVLLNQAQISTVHSFCTNLLRENFHKINIRHDFKIAEEVKVEEIKKAAIDAVLERSYEDAKPDFLRTVDAFGGKKNDDGIVEIILKLYSFADSLAHPSEWLDYCVEIEGKIPMYRQTMREAAKEGLNNALDRFKSALDVIYTDSGLSPYIPTFEDGVREITYAIEKIDDYKAVAVILEQFLSHRLASKSKDADEQNVKFVKAQRDAAKKAVEKVYNHYCITDEEIEADIAEVRPYVNEFVRLTKEFLEEFSKIKRDENILDFSDLEHFAVSLLEQNDDLKDELKGKYKEIFVDEYQDTNGVQSYLFELLTNGNNLFLVGDVKQSIYGFRNSNPQYFVEKYDRFSTDGNEQGTDILLSHNFRSSNTLLSFINTVFEGLMSEKVGDVCYNDEHRLVFANNDIHSLDETAEIHIIDTNSSADDDDDEQMSNVALEAEFIANRITRLIEEEKVDVFDKELGKNRPATYKDVVILLRKTKDVADIYAEALISRGIPVYTEEKGAYFNTIEVATAMSYLKIVENPLQDIPMLAVMRSPIFGFDDNLIAKIRAKNRYDSLYNVLKNSDDVMAKDFVEKLDALILEAKYNDVDYIIRKIVYETGYYNFVGGLPEGERRMANLSSLCQRASEFCNDTFKGIFKFVNFVENMIASGKEYSSAKLLGASDNVVTITSIHKSKGLEYPIVILADCARKFNDKDLSKQCIFDERLGFAVNAVDTKRRLKYTPYMKHAIAEKKRSDLWSEEVRLLYVALTRAKHKLIISASMSKAEEKLGTFSSLTINPYSFKAEDSYIKWIITSLQGKGVMLYTREDALNYAPVKAESEIKSAQIDYCEFYEEIDKRLKYEYPYQNRKNIPSKRSISEIATGQDENIHLAKIRQYSSQLSAAQRGTIVHFVLQNIDLSDVDSVSSIKDQLEKMFEQGMLEREYESFIDCEAIYEFFTSDIGTRMLASNDVYREFKFCVELPSTEVGYDEEEEYVLIQGVIDCCFIEDGEFVIIDYKTGSLQEKYKKQLNLYAKCLSVATGKNVKETKIYPLI